MTDMIEETTTAPLADGPTPGRRDRLERHRHAIAVCAAIAAVGATLLGWTPSSAAALTIVIAAVAIGLPHGALDVVIGPRMTKRSLFFGCYLAVAALTTLVWLVAPLLALVTFFAASWFHFARGDAPYHHRLRGAGGPFGMSTAGCALGLPLALHSGVVAPVLSDLLVGNGALGSQQVAAIGWIIAYPSIIAGIVAAIAAVQLHRYSAVAEITAVAALAVVVHPLVSFALYFALWHSPRHLIELDIDGTSWALALGASATTLIAGAVVWRLIEPSAETSIRVIFIGLAALTVPHVLVTELLRAHRSNDGRTT